MKKVLVCFVSLPEECFFVSIEADKEKLKLLRSFHNQYANSMDTPDEVSGQINDFFYTKEGNFKYTKIEGPIDLKGYTVAIMTGFIL